MLSRPLIFFYREQKICDHNPAFPQYLRLVESICFYKYIIIWQELAISTGKKINFLSWDDTNNTVYCFFFRKKIDIIQKDTRYFYLFKRSEEITMWGWNKDSKLYGGWTSLDRRMTMIIDMQSIHLTLIKIL